MRKAIAALVILLITAATAQALTLRDVMDLTKAGVGDQVLLALIEVDGGVFAIDTETLKELKAAGVSEPVIVALVRSGRARPAPADMLPPPPDVPVTAAPVVYVAPPEPIVREVEVPYPVYIAVPVSSRASHGRHDQTSVSTPSFTGYIPPGNAAPPVIYVTDTPHPSGRSEPIYWGTSGKLRPDAWKPGPEPPHHEAQGHDRVKADEARPKAQEQGKPDPKNRGTSH